MKRHPSLIPLSREHHGSLILARLLQKNAPEYKGLPTTPEGKREYALELFHGDILQHFKKEEILYQAAHHHQALQPLIRQALDEHEELQRLFNILQQSSAPEDLDRAGALLEKHIRSEERELFPLMEKVCTEEELAILAADH